MTNRVTVGSNFRRLLGYVGNPQKKAQEVCSTLRTHKLDDRSAEFKLRAALNPRTQKPVYHLVISLGPQEHLNQAQWTQVVEAYAQGMGFDQYTAFLHHNTEIEHAHVVANMVTSLGKAWDRRRDFKRLRSIAQEQERSLGLLQTRSNTKEPGVSKSEIECYERRYRDGTASTPIPPKIALRELVLHALQAAPSLEALRSRLSEKGVSCVLRTESEKIKGISFEKDGHRFSGSALGLPLQNVLTLLSIPYENRNLDPTSPTSPLARPPRGRNRGKSSRATLADFDDLERSARQNQRLARKARATQCPTQRSRANIATAAGVFDSTNPAYASRSALLSGREIFLRVLADFASCLLRLDGHTMRRRTPTSKQNLNIFYL